MSIRDQFRARSLPTEVVRLPINPTAWTRCERRLAAAQWELDAQQCMELTLRTLPPPEWEALVELHSATQEQQEQGHRWNPTTFRPAVLAACVVPEDGEQPLTADDWEQIVKDGQLAAGEYNALFTAAVNLNLRAPASAVGNGS